VEVINAQLLELGKSGGEIFFPAGFVMSVEFNPCYHVLIGEECNIGWQHNDARLCVGHEYLKAICLLGLMPLHSDEIDEESVVEVKGSCSPGANETTPVGVAHANGVST